MKTLLLSINTGTDNGDEVVTLTAKFADKSEAIAFHSHLSRLCNQYSAEQPHREPGYVSWGQRLLLAK